jgi:hypothetical protein
VRAGSHRHGLVERGLGMLFTRRALTGKKLVGEPVADRKLQFPLQIEADILERALVADEGLQTKERRLA